MSAPEVRVSPDGVWVAVRWRAWELAGRGWDLESHGGHLRGDVADEVVAEWPVLRLVDPAPELTDDALTLARLRALVTEHPGQEVPVVELAGLRRVLGMPEEGL